MVGRLGLLLIFLIVGCATLTPEEKLIRSEERAWKRQVDWENWTMCDYAYKQAGAYTIHENHGHDRWGRRSQRGITHWDIKSDLRNNNCRAILRDLWIHY